MSETKAIIKIGVDTSDNWSTRTLQKGEIALIEENGNLTGQFKVGNGNEQWDSLPLRSFLGISGVQVGSITASIANNEATFTNLPLSVIQGSDALAYTASVGSTVSGSWESGKGKVYLKNSKNVVLGEATIPVPITGISGISYRTQSNELIITQSNGDKVSCSIDMGSGMMTIANFNTWASGSTNIFYGTSKNADTASKSHALFTNNGGRTQPVYFSGGIPTACDSYSTLVSTSSFNSYTSSTKGTIEELKNTLDQVYNPEDSSESFITTNTQESDNIVLFNGTSSYASKLTGGSVGNSGNPIYINNGTPTSCTRISIGSVTASAVSCSGNVYANNVFAKGDVTAGYTSDRRLKEDIEQISESEAEKVISSLNPVKFRWNKKAEELSEGTKTGEARGFIADEFLKVLPNAGRKIWNEYDAIYYEQVIPYLVAMVQKQQREIEKLKKQLNK